MEIVGVYKIKGRGIIADVKDIPYGVKIGMMLHQENHSWKIIGVEMISPSRPDNRMGFMIKAEPGSPEEPKIGKVEI